MALLDWPVEAITAAVVQPPDRIRGALAVQRLAGSSREAALQAADNGALDLDDAAALADLPDDVAARILGKTRVGPWGIRHEIHAARSSLARKAAIAARTAELTAAGVLVIKKPVGYPRGREAQADTLLDDRGVPLDPEKVKTLPGFAAFVDCPVPSNESRTVIVCLDPDAGGYTRTTFTDYRSPQEIAEEQAEREAAEARKAALVTAGEVRWQFVTRTYGSAKAAKTLWLTVLRAAATNPDALRISDRDITRLNTLAGIPADTDLRQAGLDRASRVLVCRYLVCLEANLVDVINRVRWQADPQRAAEWLDLLVSAGYSLSDAETGVRAVLTEDLAHWNGDEILGEDGPLSSAQEGTPDPDGGDTVQDAERAGA